MQRSRQYGTLYCSYQDPIKFDFETAYRQSAATVQGGELTIDVSNGVKVNNATVIKADIIVDNGVIHVIDTVLLPA